MFPPFPALAALSRVLEVGSIMCTRQFQGRVDRAGDKTVGPHVVPGGTVGRGEKQKQFNQKSPRLCGALVEQSDFIELIIRESMFTCKTIKYISIMWQNRSQLVSSDLVASGIYRYFLLPIMSAF